MAQTRWERRDGKGTLSLRRQKEYERAGITRIMYDAGYRLVTAVIPPRGSSTDVRTWTREALEQTVILQWRVIRKLEGK